MDRLHVTPCPTPPCQSSMAVDRQSIPSSPSIQIIAQHGFTLSIYAMNLKNVLCKINACGNHLHGGHSLRLRGSITPIWAPRCRLKEGVHSIRTHLKPLMRDSNQKYRRLSLKIIPLIYQGRTLRQILFPILK